MSAQERGVYQAVLWRAKRLITLKAAIVMFVAAYLYADSEAAGVMAVSPLWVAISSIGLALISAPALAKRYYPWAVATSFVSVLTGWVLACGVELTTEALFSPSAVELIQSILVKIVIVALYLKVYFDFTVLRGALKSSPSS